MGLDQAVAGPLMRVDLSSRAERSLRELPRPEQQAVAHRIDQLAAHGIPEDSLEGEGGTRIVVAGNQVLMCVQGDGAVIVAALEGLEEPTRSTIRRAAQAP